uniref:L-Lysine epsilon oxidase N-terminal domain-containing protein n=1 Tax=uncultured Thiotrichaceae bacterium TaxID=298394 RepID=A0A6S6UML5_9GAMM|nr:MAG: Unknown protein [uncultured Thiotrichaceae bacterium]
MAFPDDLTNVSTFKIHPAIGVARLANNDDYYEFFDYEEKRNAGQAQTLQYMSLQNGNHWIMRQAVQFRIFAYADDGSEIGELSEDIMSQLGVQATWTASVANRKLNNWSAGRTPVVAAEASVEGDKTERLEGKNPWRGGKVWLGDITGQGLFIPPKGGVYRKTADTVIPPYGGGSHERDNDLLDTTSDGSISVNLDGVDGLPVLPACVIVAPQQHSPDVNPKDLGGHNLDFIKATRQLLNIPEDASLVGEGYEMDAAMMNTINADYNPGMEINLSRGNTLPIPDGAFYPRGQGAIDENEIRPSYESGRAVQGALTAGLCSTWQTDLTACLDWWTAEFPDELNYDTGEEIRELARKEFAAEGPRMNNSEDLNAYIDIMDIGRALDGDPDFLHGTERDSSDNAGSRPQAPFPLEPDQ